MVHRLHEALHPDLRGGAVSVIRNQYVGRTTPTNGWNKQLAFPSEGYRPDDKPIPYWDTHQAKRDAAQGRKLWEAAKPVKRDCSGNRVNGNARTQAIAWVQRTILNKPHQLTSRQVWELVDQVEAMFKAV